MKTLFLDVASNQGSLAVIQEDQVLLKTIDHRISDSDLVPMVEAMLKDASCSYTDLTHLACVTGPGGFTSLRVGVAFANALASQLKIPVAGVHLSDLYAARVRQSDFLWLHSTKKHEIFIRGFGSFVKDFSEAQDREIETIVPTLPEKSFWTGELIPEHLQLIESRGMQRLPLTPLEEGLPSFLKTLVYSNDLLQPWYGRKW